MTTALFLSVAEAARAVGLSESTIWAAIKTGELAAFKPRVNGKPIRSVRIEADELRAWLRAGDAA